MAPSNSLIALIANWSQVDDRNNEYPSLDADIMALQEPLAERLSEAGHAAALLSATGRRYLLSQDPREPRPVAAKEGPLGFFVD